MLPYRMPKTAFSMPISVMPLIRFFFKDIVKYLLLVTLFWSCRPLWTGIFVKLFCELLADDSAHLTDGLHTADQVLHSHIITSKTVMVDQEYIQFRNLR